MMFLLFFQFLRAGIVHYRRSNIVPLETDASRHEHKLFFEVGTGNWGVVRFVMQLFKKNWIVVSPWITFKFATFTSLHLNNTWACLNTASFLLYNLHYVFLLLLGHCQISFISLYFYLVLLRIFYVFSQHHNTPNLMNHFAVDKLFSHA